MKSFHAQTYYELLEVSVTATEADIRHAYERLAQLYGDEQVALYGLIDADQAASLRASLKEAHDALLDEVRREAYDVSIGLPPKASPKPKVEAAPRVAVAAPVSRPEAPAPATSYSWGSGGGYSYVSTTAAPVVTQSATYVVLRAPETSVVSSGSENVDPPTPVAQVNAVANSTVTSLPVAASTERADSAKEPERLAVALADAAEGNGNSTSAMSPAAAQHVAPADELAFVAPQRDFRAQGEAEAEAEATETRVVHAVSESAPADAVVAVAIEQGGSQAASTPPVEVAESKPATNVEPSDGLARVGEAPRRVEVDPTHSGGATAQAEQPDTLPSRETVEKTHAAPPLLASRELVDAPPSSIEAPAQVAATSDTAAQTHMSPEDAPLATRDDSALVAIKPVVREFRPEPKSKPFEVPSGVEFNGDLLRQVRMAKGLSMLQVSERTKISMRHLENVEGDRYQDLPATVYLRGILMSLSRELGLDGLRVSKSYLAFVDAHRSKD